MNTNRMSLLAAAAILAGMSAPVALAHTTGNTMTSGLLHPLVGLDHLLALLGVGLFAARFEGRMRWLLPMVFVGSLLAGSLLGLSRVSLPWVEPMIGASVVFFGLALLPRTQSAPWLGAMFAGFFAVFHGHAHGNEYSGVAPATFVMGMLFTSALVLAASTAMGVRMHKLQSGWLARIAGLCLAGCGAWLMS